MNLSPPQPKKRKFGFSFTFTKLMPDLDEYMTVKEAAQELGFTARGIHMLIKKAKLEARLVGKMYLIPRNAVKVYQGKTMGMSKNDPTRGKSPKKAGE